MNVAVITAIFGDMDDIKTIPPQTIPYDRFIFNENKCPIPYIEKLKLSSPRLKAKYFKCLSHKIHILKNYDAFLWIDASIEIKINNFLEILVNKLEESKSDIVIPYNRFSDCIYDGAKRLNDNIDNPYFYVRFANHPIMDQVEYYKSLGHPDHWGLWCAGLFLRLNNIKMNKCYDEWWKEILKWTTKDQHSQAFVFRKHDVKICSLPNTFEKNLVTLHPHKKLQ